MALLALLILVALLGLFLVPTRATDGEIISETLLKHPDHIPNIYGELVLDLIEDPSTIFFFLLIGIPVIALPGFTLYCAYRFIAWPRNLSGRKAWITTMGLYLLLLAGLSTWGTLCNPFPQSDPSPVSLGPFGDTEAKSKDLESDLQTMWSVGQPAADRTWVMATDEAIEAACRVFNTLDLVGIPLEEAKKTLKLELRAENYGYKAPFWPAPDNSFTLRFDNGFWGLQYNLITNEEGEIIEVQREWIH